MHMLFDPAQGPPSATGNSEQGAAYRDATSGQPPERLSLDASLRGESAAMKKVKNLIARIAASPTATVLVTGESGTGKDVAAHLLHDLSTRRAGPFVNITCSALPEPLLESELFGHERGAFTDARQRKKGLLEEASGGTVFLDEVGEMTPALQAKLLRFLEERTFRRVGGVADVHADVRVVAATHRDLRERSTAGLFREDLYYRLAVLQLRLPPLRERGDDISLLARHFVDSFAAMYGKPAARLSERALEALRAQPWKGNVRELRNVLERAVLLADGDDLHLEGLCEHADREEAPFRVVLPSSGLSLEALERDLVLQALERATGNRSRAALLLGLTRDQVRYRIEKFGLLESEASGGRAVASSHDANDAG